MALAHNHLVGRVVLDPLWLIQTASPRMDVSMDVDLGRGHRHCQHLETEYRAQHYQEHFTRCLSGYHRMKRCIHARRPTRILTRIRHILTEI